MKNLLLLTAAFFALTLSAQQEEIPDSLLQMYDLEDIVVTAQYAPTSSKNAVHEVKVIKAAEIQRQGLNNLSEVLSNQLNLRVSTDPILGNGLKIQGIGGENIQIMMDGVPIIGRVGGDVDLSQINMNNVERIEIIEGAMSAQYGSNAAGGVVNIITKKSQLKKVEFTSNNQYESIGIRNHALGLGVRHKAFYAAVNVSKYDIEFAPIDSMRVLKTASNSEGNEYQTKKIPWNPKTQLSLEGTLRYAPSDSLSLTYKYRQFEEDLFRFGQVRRPQFRPYTLDEIYTTNRTGHSLTAEVYLNENLYLKSTTAYNEFARTKEVQRLDIEQDTIKNIFAEQDTANFTALLHRSILSTVSKGKFNGQIGIEILHETGTGKRIIDSTSLPINQAQLTNYAAWAGLRFQATERLLLSGNLRAGHNTKYKHPLIPSFNADFKINENWRTKMSYAHGFRAPTLKELHFNFVDSNHNIVGNPDLLPESSRNASLSINFAEKIAKKSDFSASAKVFYNYISNRIILAEYAELKFNYQNVSEFQTHGINLTASYQIGKQLTVKSGFAYTRLFNSFSEETDSDKFIGISEWQNELLYTEPITDISFNITHRFIGQQVRFYYDSESVLQQGFIGNYHLVNASVSRSFWKKKVFTSFGLKNLTDTQAVPVIGASGGTHSASGGSQLLNWGRTWFVKVDVRF